MAMNVMETPASVPSMAARGVMRRTHGAMKPPKMRIRLCRNTQASPASQAAMGSPVCAWIGPMMTNTTTNIWATPNPEGNAHTSLRPVRAASR